MDWGGLCRTIHGSKSPMSTEPDHFRRHFRQDINGLRAWAVVAVVLYHFGVPGIRGGFVGVDVFFVISGFLMTGLIINGLDTPGDGKSFSILDFYLARARRIVPALVVLCAVLLVLGWFFLSELDYQQLGIHVASALAFVSNFKFWSEAGYFDLASHEKWLLHSWSLSVEWQFYLILPWLLVWLWRLRPSRSAVTGWLLTGFVVSLAWSVILTPTEPGAAFYLLTSRAWEMLAGGLVFMLGRLSLAAMARRVMELTGFALILGSIAVFDPATPWPGWRALVPVVGAVFVLTAARTGSLWTGTRVAQWLGNASYSIYLWHWPVVVGLAYAELLGDPWAVGAGLLTSLLLGLASYRWVERPSRQALAAWTWKPNLAALAVTGMVAVAGVGSYMQNGVAGRVDPRINAIFAEASNKNPRKAECHVRPPSKVPECTYGGPQLGAIVIGDSHAASLVRSVEKSLPSQQHVLDWTANYCATLRDVRFKDPGRGDHCGQFVRQAIEKSKRLAQAPLLIVNRSSSYLHGPNEVGREAEFGQVGIFFDKPRETLEPGFLTQWRKALIDTACEFARTRPVYMMRPIPELRRDVPRTMGRAALRGLERRVSIRLEEYHERHRLVWEAQDDASAQCGIQILDPLPYLCRAGRCWGDQDGMPLYYDDNHLSERGAALLQPLFATLFRDQLVQPTTAAAARP